MIAKLIVAVAVLCGVSFGQMTPDEARAKLEARTKEREKATTQPSVQIEKLQKQIELLRQQNALLKADNDRLREMIKVAEAAKVASTQPAKSTGKPRIGMDEGDVYALGTVKVREETATRKVLTLTRNGDPSQHSWVIVVEGGKVTRIRDLGPLNSPLPN